MRTVWKTLQKDERGVSAMEYAILAGIVVVALAAVSASYRSNVVAIFATMWNNVSTATSSGS